MTQSMAPDERCAALEQAITDPAYEPGPVVTDAGTVDMVGISVQQDQGVSYVSVMVNDPAEGDPHFRIFNPPTLVPDPAGDVIRDDGSRWRVDPVAAVAQAIANAGGARK